MNLKPFMVFFLLNNLSATEIKLNFRIMGGISCNISDHPYYVFMRVKNAKDEGMSCGGVIISEWYVLTAAHCVQNRIKGYVLIDPVREMGVNRFRPDARIQIHEFIPHRSYNERTLKYDVGLVKLNNSVEAYRIAEIVDKEAMVKILSEKDATIQVMGYGGNFVVYGKHYKNFSLTFQCLKTTISKECTGRMKPNYMFCSMSFGDKACLKGDSGGPVMYEDQLVGIVSWGITEDGVIYTIYARVDVVSDWVEEQINSLRSSGISTKSFRYLFFLFVGLYVSL